MIRLLQFALLFAALMGTAGPAHADSQDIAAVARSVVRVALVATRDDAAYFVGHGSGIVVAPDKVLTNAHVVELTRDEPNIVIGVIPAEGTKSYGARVIAYSPGNDLALLQLTGAQLSPATFFASGTQDGQAVMAIGYPASVDQAQGMSLADIIQPMSPVKTAGTISAGRSSKQYDTILHTAPLAAGSSGGPLTDTCGRILGVNSFESLSDGTDATYGFAVSNREVASFLRQAGVQPQRTVTPCRSLAEIDAADRAAAERDRIAAEAKAAELADASRERNIRARQEAEQSVIAARENHFAGAALLLALAVLAAGWAGLSHSQQKQTQTRNAAIAAALLLAGAVLVFFLRPGFSQVDDRAAAITATMASKDGVKPGSASTAPGADGTYLCRIDMERSRVTVSDTSDLTLGWRQDGCVNGRTQFAQNGTQWSRILAPNSEARASVRSFDPLTGTWRAENYALDSETMEGVRAARGRLTFEGCTADPEQLEALSRMESEMRALLPPQPNERQVYRCALSR